MKREDKQTLLKVAKKTFDLMPDIFNGREFSKYFNRRAKSYYFPDTAKRMMRYLRQDNKINYIVIDRLNSIYQKL